MKRAIKKIGRMYYFFDGITMKVMKDTGTKEDQSRYDLGNYFDVENSSNARKMEEFLKEVFNEAK